ncbi:MAG: LLM class flavin-dependent oxidoreductase [Solirubrobacteraceae bacterium]|nr:LLM class flavin-dependent oxidoreductase [Solirubrobacteraceae bacterium]
MPTDRTAPRLGVFLTPLADDVAHVRELARTADRVGLDLVGIQDHPYQRRFVDTWALMATVLADTTRITVFPDVANLPLRPPAVLAKTAASLDLLSGGRFELGLGAGGFWDAIEAMGGPRRTPGASVDALVEAIEVLRLMWSGDRNLRYDGDHYRLAGAHAAPATPHPVGIWLGAYGPRMLRTTGRLADGWVPSLGFADRAELRDAHRRIDDAATDAGRDPSTIRRVLNITGAVLPAGEGRRELDGKGMARGAIAGDPAAWVDHLAPFVEDGFDAFVLGFADETVDQVRRWGEEVAPLVADRLG